MGRRVRVDRRVRVAVRLTRAAEPADGALCLPRTVPEALSPLPAIVPGQLLALRLAEAGGYDRDKPRGLQKITRTL